MEISNTTAYPMIEGRTSPNAWRAKEREMGTTIGRFCVGLALILTASAVSAQTLEDSGNEHFAGALEARAGDVLDRSVNLAAERALASLEAREAERLDEAARSVRGRVEQRLVAVSALEPPGGRLDERAVPAGVRTDEPEPKVSRFVGTAEPRPLAQLSDPHRGPQIGPPEWGFPLDVPN